MKNTPADLAERLRRNKEEYEAEQARLWAELGPAFLEARLAAGLRQVDVAGLAGVKAPTVHHVEQGTGLGNCSIETLGRMAEVLAFFGLAWAAVGYEDHAVGQKKVTLSVSEYCLILKDFLTDEILNLVKVDEALPDWSGLRKVTAVREGTKESEDG